jgi:hypothetical protein
VADALAKLKYTYLQINTLLWRETETEYIKAKNTEAASKHTNTNSKLDEMKANILAKKQRMNDTVGEV